MFERNNGYRTQFVFGGGEPETPDDPTWAATLLFIAVVLICGAFWMTVAAYFAGELG